jgi:hypothetical protein
MAQPPDPPIVEQQPSDHDQHGRHHHRQRQRVTRLLATLLLVWLLAAYFVIPFLWKQFWDRDANFDDNPRITETSDGHPGDPLNVALIGSEVEIKNIMQAAEWYPAAALGLESDLEIVAGVVLDRPDDHAPVSNLYLFGRKEDLAFEQPAGNSPRHRHHVRLWKTPDLTADGRTQWIGAAVYDEKVGFSDTTGQITHITAPNVDAERDYLFKCLDGTDELADEYEIPDFHKKLSGTNGGGDPWETDGALYIGVIAASDAQPSQ